MINFEKQFKQILCEQVRDDQFPYVRATFINAFKDMWILSFRSPHFPHDEEYHLKQLINILRDDTLTNNNKIEIIDEEWVVSDWVENFSAGNWDEILLELSEEQAGIILDGILEWVDENVL